MCTNAPTEAVLNEALGRALIKDSRVAAWFLSRTQFAKEVATCDFCRWDNPWGIVPFEVPNAVTGEMAKLLKQCETDVLAVFATSDGRRLALHIENKLAAGSFRPNQPELYQKRKNEWKGRDKLGKYTDATAILIAPRKFYARLSDRADLFDSFISHEEIAAYVPAFRLEVP